MESFVGAYCMMSTQRFDHWESHYSNSKNQYLFQHYCKYKMKKGLHIHGKNYCKKCTYRATCNCCHKHSKDDCLKEQD